MFHFPCDTNDYFGNADKFINTKKSWIVVSSDIAQFMSSLNAYCTLLTKPYWSTKDDP